MEHQRTHSLKVVFTLIFLVSTVSSENDLDLKFCGIWRHSKDPLSLSVNLTTGCKSISVSANGNTLSIDGQITAQCRRSDVIPLNHFLPNTVEESYFCLYWEPLLDQLKLQLGERNLTLCWPSSVQGSCCTDLSHGSNTPEAPYGIMNGMIKTDTITKKILRAYNFDAASINCETLCDPEKQGSTQLNIIRDTAMKAEAAGIAEHPCARSLEVEMKEDFRGSNVSSPVPQGVSAESSITVRIPPALKTAAKKTSKVHLTFFKNNSLFKDGLKESRILDDVVEITVENEIITDLPEPIRIVFQHNVIPKTHERKCVSWDTRKDSLQVTWLVDGCETRQTATEHTECLCNHLTYFAVLVQLKPRPVCHLLALTAITSLGCAVSVISCVALIVFLCKKRRFKEQSIPIHLGLAVSLALLNLLFFLTGVLANVGGESVCAWVAPLLHYTLLSSLSWMAVEVFHTFWLVHIVFSPSPRPYVWNMVGFALPAVPVFILVTVGDIYGVREVQPCEEPSNPYLMCWMKTSQKALLAHYFTNVTLLVILVSAGFVILFLVYRQIRTREEWRQNKVAFFSIWGLSCLFGSTWSLNFLDFGSLSEFFLFLSCILNSFQGFLLMLRFYILDWMRKKGGGSALGSTSSGSTRQHMLQEKS